MNIRKLIVDGLYPLCSDEVKILIDQMRNKPEKFADLLRDSYSLSRDGWNKILLQKNNFGVIDSIAVHHQFVQLKHANTKQMILEALLNPQEESNEVTKDMLKAQIDAQFKKDYADYKKRNNI